MSEINDAPSWSAEVNQWREKGNGHFRQQEWQKALDCYKSGLALLDSESSDDAKVARCLLNGNTAQAAFQLGNYSDSFDWAMQALDSGVAKDPVKLKFRAAMSLLYAKRFEECRKLFPDVSQATSTINEIEHSKEHPFKVIPSSGRSSLRTSFEYYWFGNEEAASYLIPAAEKQRDHRICLVGSSGCARHIQATIRDFAVRKDTLLELHVIDLEPRTCARSLILLSVLTAWGKARAQKVTNSLKDKLFDLYWYVLFSVGIPRSYLALLDVLIESLCDVVANPTSTMTSAKKPTVESLLAEGAWYLVASKTFLVKSSHASAVQNVLQSWHSKNGDPVCRLSELPNFHFSDQSFLAAELLETGMLTETKEQALKFFRMLLITSKRKTSLVGIGQMMPDPQRVLALAEPGTISIRQSSGVFKVDWEKVAETQFKRLLQDAFQQWLSAASENEIRTWYEGAASSISLMVGKIGKDLGRIQQRFAINMPDSESVTTTDIRDADEGGEWDPTYPVDAVHSLLTLKSREEIDTKFAVNPTTSIYASEKDPFNPKRRDCLDDLALERALKSVIMFTTCISSVDDLQRTESMVARLGRFAHPIADLLFAVCCGASKQKMRLTYACEAADDFSVDRLRRLDLAKLQNKPVPYYDVIRMSNVPDYFGLLNSCIAFLPLLKPRATTSTRTTGTPFMSHEILYNTSIFPSMQAFTSTGLCVATGEASECAQVGFRLIEGDIFSQDILWDRLLPKGKHSLSTAHALEWVQRVFRSVAEAPAQSPEEPFSEIFPNTIVTVFKAVDWLVREALILPHHASQICEQFYLEKDVVITRAKAPVSNSTLVEENIAASVKAFQKELRAIGSLMRIQLTFPLVTSADDILVSSSEVRRVQFKFPSLKNGTLSCLRGNRLIPSPHSVNSPLGLGLIVVETEEDYALVEAGFKQSCWTISSVFRNTGKRTMATSDLKNLPSPVCRQFLPYIMSKLSRKSSVHLFSSTQLRIDKTCSVFMCAKDVEFFESKAEKTVVFLYLANQYSVSEFAEEVQTWKDLFVSSG